MNAQAKGNLKKLTGKHVFALKKDGTVISGKLVRTKNRGYAIRVNRKHASTKAFVPLVLFDLLAIGTQPYYYGYPYYPVYDGYYPYGYGPGYFY